MPKLIRCGYDFEPLYTVQELTEMYVSEGLDVKEAEQKAREIVSDVNLLTYRDRRFWRNTRVRESVGGLRPQDEDRTREENDYA